MIRKLILIGANMNNSCVFCKIASWETPSQRVYEDDEFIAFLDINPVNFGHILLIPRAHYVTLHETPDEVLSAMIKLAKKLVLAIVEAMQAQGYNIGVNTGIAAGQAIWHVHFHLIPRFEGDGLKTWAGRERYDEGEMGKTAKKIKEAIKQSQ